MADFFDKTATFTSKQMGRYLVVQFTLTEAFIGTGSKKSSLVRLQDTINKVAAMGYKLTQMSSTSVFSKSLLGGDKNQVTLIFEKDNTLEILQTISADLRAIREKLCPTPSHIKEKEIPINKTDEVKAEIKKDVVYENIEDKVLAAISVMDTKTLYDITENNSDDSIKEIIYLNAFDKLNSGKKLSAKALFKIISNYKNVEEILKELE